MGHAACRRVSPSGCKMLGLVACTLPAVARRPAGMRSGHSFPRAMHQRCPWPKIKKSTAQGG